MSSAPRNPKKKKKAKAQPVQKKEPEVVTCKLADNDYTGIIREGPLGAQYLDCATAHYTWNSGIKYDGPFNMSQIEGKGVFEWPDGSTYNGELHGGKRHGQGLYISKDRVTKYDGQWCMGKRHGEGKLSYNSEGTSFYEGAWKEGKKYGEGKQVWPSGNSYNGQWEDGQMRGKGTMTWHNQGQVETYTGNWEESQPDGEGTHTWLAPEPKPDQAFKDTTSQQLNNRYQGQWVKGQRHGRGTFYYANGAYYSGEWEDHVKHGKGRHVFEDGRIYDGPFVADSMTEYKAPEPSGLNFGNDDNPVRRMIDISDIQMFACPYDNRGLTSDNSAALMYLEPTKILREVYNMLLRSLGDLKELYYRYRVLLPVPGEDPFVLSSHQFWLFARDCGLLSPTCMVHRLDRHLFSGPRHHIEVAPEDSEEVRPLTPREPVENEAEVLDEDDGDDGEGEDGEDDASSAYGSADASPKEASRKRSSAQMPVMQREPSKDVATLPVEELQKTCSCGNEFVDEERWCSKCGAQRLQADAAPVDEQQGAAVGSAVPRIPRFRRAEANVANIHGSTTHLLFRQFVEGVVRVALARYPCERSLEVQCQRLFKEKLLPHLECLRRSEKEPSQKALDFIADPEIEKVMNEFRPRLQRLFRGGVVSEDVHETETWVADPKHAGRCAKTGHLVRMRHYGDFGAPRHHLHVSARLDKTIRVKDALRLFSNCGLLRGLKKGDVPWADLSQAIFAYAQDEDLLVLDEQERQDFIAAQESGSTTPSEDDIGGRTLPGMPSTGGGMGGGFGGFGGGSGGMGGFGGLGGAMDQDEDKKRRKGGSTSDARSRRRGKKEGDEDEKASKDKDEHHEGEVVVKPPIAALADFISCDFTITPLQALRIILEVASPESVKALHWMLDPARVPISHENISLLEFAETELIFTEFVRILLRVSDLGTRKDIPLCERLSATARFEGFLRHVFFPALRTPYVPPLVVDEAEKGSDAARTNENAEALLAPSGEAPEAKSGEGSNAGEDVAEAAKEESLQDIDMWAGFDDYSRAEAEAHASLRRWPSGYEQEIASWV